MKSEAAGAEKRTQRPLLWMVAQWVQLVATFGPSARLIVSRVPPAVASRF